MPDPESNPPRFSSEEIAALREKHYNATIINRIDVHEGLARFQIRPDLGFTAFEPGQYVALGLGNWEPRLPDCQEEGLDEKKYSKMTRRAYSISCPMLPEEGLPGKGLSEKGLSEEETDPESPATILTVNEIDYLEFYVALVRTASSPDAKPPSLTPRLFRFGAGDRCQVQKKIVGHYVMKNIEPDDTLLMISTGTGEAPHNAMVTDLLAKGHRGKIVNVTTVRSRLDLGYADQHAAIESMHANYRYLAYTTREIENWDKTHPGYIGKQYVQELFTSGKMARDAGDPLSPDNTHVFLCGNPSMIGYVPPGAEPMKTPGMLQVLGQAGFVESDHADSDKQDGPGTIRFEKYW